MTTRTATATALAVLVAAALTACGPDTTTDPAQDPDDMSQAEWVEAYPDEQTISPGQSGEWDRSPYADGTPATSWEVSLAGVECGATTLPEADYAASPGMVICEGTVTVTNTGRVPDSPPPVGMLDVDGTRYDPLDYAVQDDVSRARTGEGTVHRVAPGAEWEQVTVWEVPEGTTTGGVVWPAAGAAQYGLSPTLLLTTD